MSCIWDNGSEASGHRIVDQALSMACCFANLYSSWQRGCNENRNGQIHRYFSKGTGLTRISRDEVDQAVAEINNRSMPLLVGLTSAQAVANQLRQQPEQKTTCCLYSSNVVNRAHFGHIDTLVYRFQPVSVLCCIWR